MNFKKFAIFKNKFNRNYNKIIINFTNCWAFLNNFLNKCKKLKKNFAKIMCIVNEILLKILANLKKNINFKKFLNLEKICLKFETNYLHCSKYKTY